MRLDFDGIADFIGKRVNLINTFEKTRQGIEDRLSGVETFSKAELEGIPGEEVARYFFLKELIGNNPTFTYGVPRTNHTGKVKVVGRDGDIGLELKAYRPDESRILNFLAGSYDSLPEENQAWLIGERRENGPGEVSNPSDRHDYQFNTGEIIEDAKLTDTLVLTERGENVPRSGYDEAYQIFRSPEGFGPIVDFCLRHPHEFFQALIITPGGELYLEPERKRQRGWDVTHYSTEVRLTTPNGKGLVELGSLADEHLAAA